MMGSDCSKVSYSCLKYSGPHGRTYLMSFLRLTSLYTDVPVASTLGSPARDRRLDADALTSEARGT